MARAADLSALMHRFTGLVHRGLASLRTRGWMATWRRVRKQFERVPAARRLQAWRPPVAPFAPFAVPTSDMPHASIVIPVFNQFAHTLDCLRALAAHPPRCAFEVIVIDDGSTDGTVDALPRIAGIRPVVRASNGGFIAACNDGAAVARGRFIVLLNNDTVPQPGWLDTLLASFETDPSIGLAGAQLIQPDGSIQESGARVFRDGAAAHIGRGASPDDPRFAYLRDVDYVSGAALAIERALWIELGGLDTRYAPAYHEDADLAFAVRATGRRVVVQPMARVLHDEGTTGGMDVRAGPKRQQIGNREVFARKWADVLRAHPLDSGHIDMPPPARTVLVVDAETPRPSRDSASLRLVNVMRLLRTEGAHVVFVPADGNHAGIDTAALQAMGVEVWYAPFLDPQPSWLAAHGPRFDVALVCRHHVLQVWLPLLRRYAPQARVVFDTVDLHHVREQRGAELTGDIALQRSAARTRTQELALVARSDVTLVVGEAERVLLATDVPDARVHVLSNVHAVSDDVPGFDARRDVVFVGGFRHPPNVDAVEWFVRAVWPRVHAVRPGLVFHCVGANPTPVIRAFDGAAGVRVHGYVADLDPYILGARIAVAPLRYGAGVKGKVNLSMAHGQPVVATPCAVESMHLVDGVDVLVADDAQAFADAILRLDADAALWTQLSNNGRANVQRHFSFEAARDVVRDVVLAPMIPR